MLYYKTKWQEEPVRLNVQEKFVEFHGNREEFQEGFRGNLEKVEENGKQELELLEK